LDSKTKEKRASVIKEISAKKHLEFLQKNIGTVQEVLIEKNLDRKTGMLKGVSRNYLNVLIDSNLNEEDFRRRIKMVKIKAVEGQILGQII